VITFTDVTDRKERERVLQTYNEVLEKNVAERTTQMEAQAREMALIAEQERQQLGRQLHDTLGQQLTAIGVLAATVRERRGSDSAQAEVADKLEAGIDEAKQQIRSVLKGLIPVDVDAHGLRIALEELANETAALFRISCRFECDDALSIDDNFAATQLYLVAREAVQNAARHAKASHIAIKLQDSDGLHLSVEDDGRGLPQDVDKNAGLGLRIMHYRSDLVGGKLQIDSHDGRGTRVLLQVQTRD
jgi:signal transduction histidine kinase